MLNIEEDNYYDPEVLGCVDLAPGASTNADDWQKRLAMRMIKRAYADLCGFEAQPLDKASAAAWIESVACGGVSFEACCTVLRVDAAWLRATLLQRASEHGRAVR